jgi:TolB-like protein
LADIFVSYASSDLERVTPLVVGLEKAGFSVWWDQSLRGGSMFTKEIEVELESADLVLAVWTEASLDSRWVADEAEHALRSHKLIPIILDDIEPPIGFRQVQCIDFSKWQGDIGSDAFKTLLRSASAIADSDGPMSGTTEAEQQSSNTISIAGMSSRRRVLILAASIFIGVIGAIVLAQYFQPSAEAPSSTQLATTDARASIAVLPFANMSGDPDQEYFSDGISEELLNVLAKAKDLRVAARTSSFSFKGKDRDIREIGSQLNVDTVLEGSLRKSGTKLRITAQLIDVATGYHMWSETFDREITDIFTIQDEIARSITSAMSPHLIGLEETTEPKYQPNLDAYDYYLAGRRLYVQRTPASLGQAIELFDKAIVSDPLFAAAYAHKALAIEMSIEYRGLPLAEAEPQVISLTNKALELDPDLALAFAVRGNLYWTKRDYRRAFIELERAASLDPNLVEAHLWLAMSLNVFSRLKDGWSKIEQAYELDPLHPSVSYSYAKFLRRLGRYKDAHAVLDKRDIIHTAPNLREMTRRERLYLSFVQGEIAEANRQYKELSEVSSKELGNLALYRPHTYLSLRAPNDPMASTTNEGMAWLQFIQGNSSQARSFFDAIPQQELSEKPARSKLLLGAVLALEGNFEAAVEAFEQVPYERLSIYRAENCRTLYAWSLIEAGRHQEANRVLDDVMQQIESLKKDGAVWHLTAREESEVHLLRGDSEKAIDVLLQAYDQGMRIRAWKNVPIFKALREHPRFVTLFDRINKDFEAARIEVDLNESSN